jgi:ribosome-associated protein
MRSTKRPRSHLVHEDITLITPVAPETAKTPRRKTSAKSPATVSAMAADVPQAQDALPQPPSDTLALATHALEEMKAEDTIIIDLQGKTSIADQMIITSGRSNRHVGSIADEVVKTMKDAGHGSPRVEGVPHCDWVLIDCGDVIVHVFRPEVRQFYNLEKMWGVDRPTEAAS